MALLRLVTISLATAGRQMLVARRGLAGAPRAGCRAAAADEPLVQTAAAHAERVLALHKQLADAADAATTAAGGGGDRDRAAHLARQARVFDAAVGWFESEAATPPDVADRLRVIARLASPDGRAVVDVGCGAGALVPFLKAECGLEAGAIVGVDVSPAMAASCAARHAIRTHTSDFDAWALARAARTAAGAAEPPFGACVFNAMFGNLHSQRASLAAACAVVDPAGGRIVISHPLGRAFVERLVAADPAVVPAGLPADARALAALAEGLPLRLVALHDEGGETADAPGLYAAVFEQWVPHPLARVLLMRGAVARGYGRGSRTLGIPTANLNEDEFGGKLAEVPTGVYAGYAVVEDAPGPAGAAVHACVVNVGYSPTFAGAENCQKIVEAHVLPAEGSEFVADFYGRPMRLLLCAFIRPEHKFAQFPLLVPAIRKDIAEAKRLLAAEPLRVFGRDPFLLMGLASDGTVGLLPGRGGRAGAGGLFKAVDFALAAEMAGLQSSES